MPFLIPFILGILAIIIVQWLLSRNDQGRSWARWILGGGMFVSTLILSRLFGAQIFYVFLPFLQRWLMGKNAQQHRQSSAPTEGAMSKEEAALILGIEQSATEQEVKAAYKKMMVKLHPDQGGNDYLASKLNEAREVMLRG